MRKSEMSPTPLIAMPRLQSLLRAICLAILLLCANASIASPPQSNTLEYEGRHFPVWPRLTFPWNERLHALAKEISQTWCSALGGIQGNWRIDEDRLYLTGLRYCGRHFTNQSIYGGDGAPIFADWVTNTLAIEWGKELCRGSYTFPGVPEKRLEITVENGIVKSVNELSNRTHRMVPTPEYMRYILVEQKMLSNSAADILIEDAISQGGWPCLSTTAEIEKQREFLMKSKEK